MSDETKGTDWRTLPAGRELDALVAEKVFGWVWKLDQDSYRHGGVSEVYRVICEPRLWGDAPLLGLVTGAEPARIDRPYNGQNPPHYSTDIAAAWAVVEKWQASGHTFQLGSGAQAEYVAIFARVRPERRPPSGPITAVFIGPAESAPLAICRAALAAAEAADER